MKTIAESKFGISKDIFDIAASEVNIMIMIIEVPETI